MMNIRRYQIDLSAQMATCDANYIRILKLLPDLDVSRSREIAVPGKGVVERIVFVVEVVETFKYTSTVRISQRIPDSNEYYRCPEMHIRIYHDANTAEVVSYQNHRYFKSVYPFPNRYMYHPDEKEQLNRFLTEWLSMCLEKGVSNDDVMPDERLDCAET